METLALQLFGASNPGVARRKNEDNFLCCAPPGAPCALAVVADGIGGHQRGDLASFIICRRLLLDFRREYRTLIDSEIGRLFLTRRIQAINQLLCDRNDRERAPRPMGSTIVAALFLSDAVVVANAGDSRLYEYLPGSPLRQLTTDHVPTRTQYPHLEERMLRNAILRAVGTSPCLRLDVQVVPRPATARYLLCSDGLSRPVSDQLMAQILSENADPRLAVSRLLRQAIVGNGRDNITAILAVPRTALPPVTG